MIYVHPRLLKLQKGGGEQKLKFHVTQKASRKIKNSNCARSMYEKVDRMTSMKKTVLSHDDISTGEKCKMINHNRNDLYKCIRNSRKGAQAPISAL